MSKLAKVVGPDLLTPSLLSLFENLKNDSNWRVRMAVFELIGDLILEYGTEISKKGLMEIFMSYLTNTAASVREMGIAKSAEISKASTPDWVVSYFIPKVVASYNTD